MLLKLIATIPFSLCLNLSRSTRINMCGWGFLICQFLESDHCLKLNWSLLDSMEQFDFWVKWTALRWGGVLVELYQFADATNETKDDGTPFLLCNTELNRSTILLRDIFLWRIQHSTQ